jgi:hypothetical protein
LNSDTTGVAHGFISLDWTAAGTPVIAAIAGTNTLNSYVKQVGSGAFYWVVISGSGVVNSDTNRIYVFPARFNSSFADDVTQQGDIYCAHIEGDNGLIPVVPIINSTGSQNSRNADAGGVNVPGGSGQAGTLYEKYIDLATGTLVEQVSALTTSSTFAPQTGRAWISWKFALGVQTLAYMQAL